MARRLLARLRAGGRFDNGETLSGGTRVEIAPHFDLWARGDRYGEVIKSSKLGVYVKMDKSGKTLRFAPKDLTVI
jgi:hypothetical protein